MNNNLIYTWKTIFGYTLMRSFATKANNISISRGVSNGFVRGTEIYYTDPTPIGNGGAQFTCYSIILVIDRVKGVTNVSFLRGTKTDILSTVNGEKMHHPNCTVMMIPTPELQSEFITNLTIDEKAINGDLAKMQLYADLKRFYNTSNTFNAPANPLETFGIILENDMQVALLTMNEIVHSMQMDNASIRHYIDNNVVQLDDGILAGGEILFSSGISIAPKMAIMNNGQHSWVLDPIPGYTLMRAVKDDKRFSVFDI